MEHHYQVTFSKAHIADYDITFIRDVMNRYLGVDHVTFNRAFQCSTIVFRREMNVDNAQLCLTELEAAGIEAQIEKLGVAYHPKPSKRNATVVPVQGAVEQQVTAESIAPRLLQLMLPNSANSAVVVFSYLIVFYQVVSFFS